MTSLLILVCFSHIALREQAPSHSREPKSADGIALGTAAMAAEYRHACMHYVQAIWARARCVPLTASRHVHYLRRPQRSRKEAVGDAAVRFAAVLANRPDDTIQPFSNGGRNRCVEVVAAGRDRVAAMILNDGVDGTSRARPDRRRVGR
mmetsp:Transcript_26210/g.61219  ORF Transcript_26210/g.61219 Transcript_26210/m.61219 type:complete len:149 (+) Transcript_26210:114-560(+)